MKYVFKLLICKLFHARSRCVGLLFSSRGRFLVCECGVTKRY